jgi:hypothetical protein
VTVKSKPAKPRGNADDNRDGDNNPYDHCHERRRRSFGIWASHLRLPGNHVSPGFALGETIGAERLEALAVPPGRTPKLQIFREEWRYNTCANRRGAKMPSLQAQLLQAHEHVRQAQKRIEEQVILIDRLRSDGHDTQAAERLLTTFIDLMAKLTLHRDELEREAEETSRTVEPNP